MLSFTGDLYLKEKETIDTVFAGEFIVNLEYPIVSDLSQPAKNKVNLSSSSGFLEESLSKRPIAACLANNHILDYGVAGGVSTIDYLTRNGVSYFGFGHRSNNYSNPFRFDGDYISYDVFGYCDSLTSPTDDYELKVAPLNVSLIKKDLLRSDADVKIVCLHWGDEENSYPSTRMVNIAKEIASSGANFIIGHHAHVIQPYCDFDGCHTFFNLGNFYFPNLNEPYGWNGQTFTGKYQKTQSKKNKQTLIVDIMNDSDFNYRLYRNNDLGVKECNKKLPSMCFYSYKNAFCNRYSTFKIMTRRFFKNPRVPTMQQVKRFLGILG